MSDQLRLLWNIFCLNFFKDHHNADTFLPNIISRKQDGHHKNDMKWSGTKLAIFMIGRRGLQSEIIAILEHKRNRKFGFLV